MSNEELAVAIQNGDTEKILVLWEQVERLVRKIALRKIPVLEKRGLTLDDLMQSGFLAVIEAVRYFKSDAEFKFTTYLDLTLKNEFDRIGGLKTKTTREDPFWKATRLEIPVLDEEDITLGDTLEDTSAAKEFCGVEEKNRFDAIVGILPPKQRDVMIKRYLWELPLSSEERKLETKALRTLRHPSNRSKVTE